MVCKSAYIIKIHVLKFYKHHHHGFFSSGVTALYKGLGPTVIRTFCATAALFYSYETSKQFLTELAYGNNALNDRWSQ